jgi:hypothetical protein
MIISRPYRTSNGEGYLPRRPKATLKVLSVAVATAAGVAVLAFTPGAAQAASCGTIANPTVPGAKAHWELQCDGGKITVTGWVQDTSADGKCAKVKAVFASGTTEYSNAACPKNDKDGFTWSHPGSIADVYLYTYDV